MIEWIKEIKITFTGGAALAVLTIITHYLVASFVEIAKWLLKGLGK